jgi:hypothetical protein
MRETSAAQHGADADTLLARIRVIFPGRYNNNRQRAMEIERDAATPHVALMTAIDPLPPSTTWPCAFLARGYGVAPAPYMARVYAFRPSAAGEAGLVRLAIHAFDKDARLLSTDLDPDHIPAIDPGAGEYHSGCDLRVDDRGGAVVCSTEPGCCIRPIGGTPDAVETLKLSFTEENMHVRRGSVTREGLPLSGRGDRSPYRLLRVT